MGSCESVWEEKVGDIDFLFLKGVPKSQTIILRGANDHMLCEV